ncbi:hypothetical protein BVRB_9g206910 [Beta vulgaris subsp. vulgaris]|nr:hypothetical protein BVRB_9g206910 [Beta vulgaris subsp. vulgaris]
MTRPPQQQQGRKAQLNFPNKFRSLKSRTKRKASAEIFPRTKKPH